MRYQSSSSSASYLFFLGISGLGFLGRSFWDRGFWDRGSCEGFPCCLWGSGRDNRRCLPSRWWFEDAHVRDKQTLLSRRGRTLAPIGFLFGEVGYRGVIRVIES